MKQLVAKEWEGWGLHLHPDWGQTGRLESGPVLGNQASGRGACRVIIHERASLVWRPYRRGGLRRLLLPSLLPRGDRAAREYRLHREAYEAGVSTVEPVGWAERRVWLPLHRRYAYLTRLLDGARPLPEVVRAGAMPRDWTDQMAAVLHRLYELGIFHADLNLNNWLASGDRLLLIDFDKSRRVQLSPLEYVGFCLRRMVRSCVKLGLKKHMASGVRARFTIAVAWAFGLPPRDVAGLVSEDAFRVSVARRLRWRLSGGHRIQDS